MEVFLVPIAAIIFGCLIAIFAIIFSYLEKKKQFETIAKLIETGKNPQEIKEYFEIKSKKIKDPIDYLKSGIITAGIGIGIFFFGLILKEEAIIGISIFIAFLGISFLVIYFLIRNKNS